MTTLGTCGPYALRRWVEAGGMGEIFLAEGPAPRAPGLAAVKRLLREAKRDPEFVAMFRDEGRLVQHLDHPGIVRVYHIGEDDGHYYIAMEWVDGVSLEKLLKRTAGRDPLPQDVITKVVTDVASALAYAHALRDPVGQPLHIVHRDVSPPNVMLDLQGHVKLLDFGMAKARTQLAKTQPGFVKGKFAYLAPEQLTGRVDARTDVFALGLCAYEMLTGQQWFRQTTAAETVENIRAYQGMPPLSSMRPDVWPELDAIIRKATAADPGERFQNAEEMKQMAERTLAVKNASVPPERIAEVVRGLFPERRTEPGPQPAAEHAPAADSFTAPPAATTGPATLLDLEDDLAREKRKKAILAVATGLVLVAGAAVALWAAF